MSIGVGGRARLVAQDEHTLIYEYAPYNLNEDEYRNAEHIFDGVITIDRTALVEPEIHEKIKKMPSGRKKTIIKRLRVDVDYESLFAQNKIKIENSRFCWHILPHGQGRIAMMLIFQIFGRYQDEGIILDEVYYDV